MVLRPPKSPKNKKSKKLRIVPAQFYKCAFGDEEEHVDGCERVCAFDPNDHVQRDQSAALTMLRLV